MARGFLSGAVWGTLVAGAGVAGLSLATDPPEPGAAMQSGVQEAALAPDPDAAPVQADTSRDVAVTRPEPEAAPEEPAVDDPLARPRAPAPERADVAEVREVDPAQPGRRPPPETAVEVPGQAASALDAPASPLVVGADTQPPRQPDIGAAPDAPVDAAPVPLNPGAAIAVTSDGPVLPLAQAEAPGLVNPDAVPDLSIAPVQPPPPPVPEEETALVADEEAAAGESAVDEAAVEDAREEAPADAVPADVAQAANESVTEEAVAEAAAPEDTAPEDTAPEDTALEDTAPEDTAPEEATPEVIAEQAPAPDRAPDEATLAEDVAEEDAAPLAEEEFAQLSPEATAVAPRPAIGQPAESLLDRDGAVTQSRLPRIGADEEAAPAQALAEDAPLIRFAAEADPAEGLPRVSVVLIDDGSGPLGPEALEPFPFPVTFAIAPGHRDPAGATAAYRELGFEVMVLADVPEGAQASDVEVALGAALDRVPQAIGVLEAPGGGLQSSRAASSQAAAYLAASGHGLLMLPKGLNTAQQLAQRAGVPSATVFRDFDGEGQDARVIRRFLDQAAFRARQEGAVVMLGRLRADTISALVLWGLQDRAAQVALVPASVVLRESVAAE